MCSEKFRIRTPLRVLFFVIVGLILLPAAGVSAETAQSLADKAQQLDKDGFYREAVTAWEEVLKSQPPKDLKTLALLKLTGTYMKLNEPNKSLEVVKQLIATSPDNFDAQFHLANAQAKMRNFPEASEAFAKTIALRPDEGLGYVGLAFALFGDGKPDEAIANLQKAKKIFKKNKNIPWYRDARIAIEQIKGFAIYPRNFADLWLHNNLEMVRNTYENRVFLKE